MLLGMEQVIKNVKANKEDYNLPAPTVDTLERYRTSIKIVKTLDYLTEKYGVTELAVLDEMRLTVHNATKQKALTPLGEEILQHLDFKVIESLTNGSTLETNYRINTTRITSQIATASNIDKLVEIAVKLVIKGTGKDDKEVMAKLPPVIATETKVVIDEIEDYLFNNFKQFLFVDTETNSLPTKKPGSGLPIQLAWILTDNNMNILESDAYFIEQDYIDYGAQKVHGISLEKLKELNPISPREAYSRIANQLSDRNNILVAHNAQFDVKVLDRLKEQGSDYWGIFSGGAVAIPEICTLAKSRKKIPATILKNKKLVDLQNYYGISESETEKLSEEIFGGTGGIHDARYDTTLLYQVAINLGLK